MSERLKIYACSGIGETNVVKEWISEGTTAADNTQAMNTLLADINLTVTRLRFPNTMTDSEIRAAYSWLDLYSICFYYARLYRNDSESLAEAGKCICKLVEENAFVSDEFAAEWHDERVNEIIDVVDNMMSAGDAPEMSGSFKNWFTEKILGGNVVGLNEVSGVGATVTKDYGDLNKYLYDGGTYFLYLYIPEEKLSELPYVFRKKRRKQQEVYNYCKKVFCKEYGGIYGDESTMQKVIRTGIIEDFQGEMPEQVAARIVNGESVNDALIISAIISAIATVLVAVLNLIINYATAVAVAKYAVPADPDSGCPEGEDMSTLGKVKKSIKDYWMWLVAGAAALFLFTSSDNK